MSQALSENHSRSITEAIPPDTRLDRYVSETWGLLGRSQLKARLLVARLNGKQVKLSCPVQEGDQLEIELEGLQSQDLVPEDLNLDILFENSDVIVLNKQAGLVVHPAAGNYEGTLVHGLLFHARDLADQGFEDEARPGIVHRLDKETSGVMIVAKNPAAHAFLSAQFQDRTTSKEYLAIAWGQAREMEFTVDGFLHRDPRNRQRYVHDPAEGKAAHTDFRVLCSASSYHLLKAWPKTGRTHQIRVHASYRGLPLIGDSVYGNRRTEALAPRCMLHAARLSIVLPGQTEQASFEAPLPQDFLQAMQKAGLRLEGKSL